MFFKCISTVLRAWRSMSAWWRHNGRYKDFIEFYNSQDYCFNWFSKDFHSGIRIAFIVFFSASILPINLTNKEWLVCWLLNIALIFLLNEFLDTARGRYFFGIKIPSRIVVDSRICNLKCFDDNEGLSLKQFNVESLIVIMSFLKVYKLWTKHSSSFCSSRR